MAEPGSSQAPHWLLERDRELDRIGKGIEGARAGAGDLLLVEGPAGIGKSALLRAAAEHATERGLGVLAARATELERELPFGAARQLLEPPLRAASPELATELLEGSARHAAPALGIETAEPAEAAAPGFATLNGLYWLLANLAEREPLLLCLDDAHWADPDSLRLLAFLAPRLSGLPALLLLAARPEEWEGPAPLAATASDPAARPLSPAPLTERATHTLLEAGSEQSVHPRFARACHTASAGNPFYLHALADELRRDGVEPTERAAAEVGALGPPAVARAIVARLARLGADAAALARAVAVLGDGAPTQHAARLAGLDQSAAQAAAIELARAAILAGEEEERLRFAHPITRNAVYGDIPRPERAELHRRAVALLAEEGAEPERVASHLLAIAPGSERAPGAGDRATPGVVATLRDAAGAALGRGAADSAIAYLRRALAEPPDLSERVELLLELGRAEALSEGPAAIEHLSEAFELAGEVRLRGTIATALATSLMFAEQPHAAVDVAQRAAEGLDEADRDLRQRLEARVFVAAYIEPSLADLSGRIAERLRREGIEGAGRGAKALAGGLARVEAVACVPAADAVALAERALEGGVLLAEDNGGPDFLTAVETLAVADSDLAGETIAAGLETAYARGDVFAFAANMLLRSLTGLLRGELVEAIADAEQGLAATEAHGGMAVLTSWGASVLASARIERGDLDDAERDLARASKGAEVPGTWHWFMGSCCLLRVARGDLRAGLETSLELGRRYESVAGRNPAMMPWRSLAALCLTGLGEQPERARELAAGEVELARVWGAPRALGAALRAQGLVVGGEDGLALLREAVGVLDGSPARLGHARALVDLGAAVRRSGSRAEAREPLASGLEIARGCGALPLVERAYSELEATGARPRKILRTGADALTPSERRVAGMAASGLTNREIAQRLFVTTKTVEFHLGQAYRKLEIGSRSELGGALGEGDGASS